MSTVTAPHLRDKLRSKFHRHHEFPATYATTSTVVPVAPAGVYPAPMNVVETRTVETKAPVNYIGVPQVIQEPGQPVETVRELTAETRVKDMTPVLRETIHVVEEEDIQPVVHLQRERTDVVHVTQPIHETQILPTKVVQGEFPPEYRPEVIIPGPPIMPSGIVPTRDCLAAERVQVLKPALIDEVVRKFIVEEIQPIIERDIYEPHLIKQLRPIYERVVEAPILLTRMCTPIERGVVGYGDFAASDFILGPGYQTPAPETIVTTVPATLTSQLGPTSVTTTTTTTGGGQPLQSTQLPVQQIYGGSLGQSYGGQLGQFPAGQQSYGGNIGQTFGQQQPLGGNLGAQQQPLGQTWQQQPLLYSQGMQQQPNVGQTFGQQQPLGGNWGVQQQPFGQGMQQQPLGGNIGQPYGQGMQQQPLGGNIGQPYGQGLQQQNLGGNIGQPYGQGMQQQPLGGNLGQQGIQQQPYGQGMQQQPNVGQTFGQQQPLGGNWGQQGAQQQPYGQGMQQKNFQENLGQQGTQQQPLGSGGQQLGDLGQQMSQGGKLEQPFGQKLQQAGQFLENKQQPFQNIPQIGGQNLGGSPPSR